MFTRLYLLQHHTIGARRNDDARRFNVWGSFSCPTHTQRSPAWSRRCGVSVMVPRLPPDATLQNPVIIPLIGICGTVAASRTLSQQRQHTSPCCRGRPLTLSPCCGWADSRNEERPAGSHSSHHASHARQPLYVPIAAGVQIQHAAAARLTKLMVSAPLARRTCNPRPCFQPRQSASHHFWLQSHGLHNRSLQPRQATRAAHATAARVSTT